VAVAAASATLVAVAASAGPRSPGAEFQSCGTMVAAPFCGLALATDSGGLYLLDQVGEFGLGDHVFVAGTLLPRCLTFPECAIDSCVQVSAIGPCGATYFSGCGILVSSFTCGDALAADDGSGIYVIDGAGANYGDHLFVEGPIIAECEAGLGFCPCIDTSATGVRPCITPGDLDFDGVVGGGDLGALLAN
jgi:hypothetical protein